MSRGSPGSICQWSNVDKQNAWPTVWTLRSVSKPIASMQGKVALMMCWGVPALGVYCLIVPLLFAKTVNTASILYDEQHWISVKNTGYISLGLAVKNDE